ncbi:signal peptidase II [Paenibacillus qinlingensis]|uniref:Lipoprotein signal peptidase n=1 Tax=Paenibacillus qinlingensis TaxID=1837343 RepID=A0ABU1NV94_9BACL|nr:signal peptidase II [Paenibacillus qinlingensis]MDR6551398.1 signal peptidase II [Paenibacillus qinlingensis]
MKYLKYYLYALLAFILDQVTKWIIVKKVPLGEERPVIGDFFMITSHRNRGAAFGILQDQRWFFISVTIVVLCGIIWYMQRTIREDKVLLPFALCLLLGGAFGNFVDRALFGEVVDFFQFTFDFNFFGKEVDYIFPIFNVADSCIVVGVILIFIESLLASRKEKKGATHEHKPDLT